MRGKKARELRKAVYGEETYRQRQYKYLGNNSSRLRSGTLRAGGKRTVYKTLKRMHVLSPEKILEYLKRRHNLTLKAPV